MQCLWCPELIFSFFTFTFYQIFKIFLVRRGKSFGGVQCLWCPESIVSRIDGGEIFSKYLKDILKIFFVRRSKGFGGVQCLWCPESIVSRIDGGQGRKVPPSFFCAAAFILFFHFSLSLSTFFIEIQISNTF